MRHEKMPFRHASRRSILRAARTWGRPPRSVTPAGLSATLLRADQFVGVGVVGVHVVGVCWEWVCVSAERDARATHFTAEQFAGSPHPGENTAGRYARGFERYMVARSQRGPRGIAMSA